MGKPFDFAQGSQSDHPTVFWHFLCCFSRSMPIILWGIFSEKAIKNTFSKGFLGGFFSPLQGWGESAPIYPAPSFGSLVLGAGHGGMDTAFG